jgi:GMP/IMP 5'-nucleotidase
MADKVISFDLDGTIVQSEFGNKVWLEGLPKAYAQEKNIPYETARSYLLASYDRIGSDKKEWYDLSYWIKLLNLTITPIELLQKYVDSIVLYPDAEDVIKSLSENYDLIISSGAMKEFIEIELSHTNLIDYFKYTFSSTTDMNIVKKDPLFYNMIAKTLNVASNNITHVGDNEVYDYISPKKAGFSAFYLCRKYQLNKHYTVFSLFEFEDKMRDLSKL